MLKRKFVPFVEYYPEGVSKSATEYPPKHF